MNIRNASIDIKLIYKEVANLYTVIKPLLVLPIV